MNKKKVKSMITNTKRKATNVVDKAFDSEHLPLTAYAVGVGLGLAAGYFIGKANGIKLTNAKYIKWFDTYKDAYLYTGNGIDITTKLSETGAPTICLHAENLLLEPWVTELEATTEAAQDLSKDLLKICGAE